MRVFIAVLVLIFSLQSWTKADDISEFEIEGISLGDSLLDYFSEKEILINRATYYSNDKFTTSRMLSDKFENFDQLDISFVTKDNKYTIIGMSGAIYEENMSEGCKLKSEEIKNFIIKTLNNINYEYEEETQAHPVDKSGKSTVETKYFYLNNGDLISVQCYNFSKETGFTNALKLGVDKKKFVEWLYNDAYN